MMNIYIIVTTSLPAEITSKESMGWENIKILGPGWNFGSQTFVIKPDPKLTFCFLANANNNISNPHNLLLVYKLTIRDKGRIVNYTAIGRARFLLCTGFIFFFSFVGDQTQTSAQPNRQWDFEACNLWCLFAKSCWNINTRKMFWIMFSLLYVKYVFFWFYWRVLFKGNIKYTKNRCYISHGMCWCCSFYFR